MRRRQQLQKTWAAWWLVGVLGAMVGCEAEPGTDVAAHTEIPAEGSCEADGMLKVANEASQTELDDVVRLDSRAAANIVAARPVNTLRELDEIAYVGTAAMHLILDYADAQGHLEVCATGGTCEETATLRVANELSEADLDTVVGLDSRAASAIVMTRPLASYAELDEVAYVGQSALGKLLAYAVAEGFVSACSDGGTEVGIVSDLDKTVVPPGEPDLSVAPYPGVTALLQLLEHRNGGLAGDMHYVTARQPEMVTEIPAYLATHGVPAGPIETGVSGLPWVAEPEKVADVSGILDATGTQRFVLFGDSSHRDPEVYKKVRELYGDRIIAAFIHKVNTTVAEHRVAGLHLHESYAEVAAILYGYGVITRDEAHAVMQSAANEGLAITESEMLALLDSHAP